MSAQLTPRTCPTCGKPFYPKRSHYWLCYPCWSKGGMATAPTAEADIAKLLTGCNFQPGWNRIVAVADGFVVYESGEDNGKIPLREFIDECSRGAVWLEHSELTKDKNEKFDWLLDDLKAARREVEQLRRRCDLWQTQAEINASLYRLAAMHNSPALPPDLAEQLPRLIQLCHPDRHNNSEAANKATQWLLKLRRERS